MSSTNIVIILGNLTRDPQLNYLPSQTPVVDFGVATNRRYKTADGEDREETCFMDCACFGPRAEVINQYLTKGSPVFIEGRLKYESWDDKETGAKRSKLVVVVERFEFVGGRGDGNGDGGGDEPPQRPAGNRGNTNRGNTQRQPARNAPQQRGAPQPRGNAPAARQPRGGPPAENPFPDGEPAHFNEADIPF